ncbi:MAG: UDP-N-acetylmuramate--L-alanine ligase [Candidatus Omnitrophica bacterium]|nr:UDP-N-acetylmuramate--L-alanine ligase [Candidatus Omnitrophota bacterium]
MILEKSNMHFVGIGGIGMSGIALVLLKMGYKVSGSDLGSNNLTEKLTREGAGIRFGHNHDNIPPETEVVVYSSSINNSNPEIRGARERNLLIVKRAEVLAELLNGKKGIAVTGTHGKTTTSSLISVMLEKCGLDPTAIIGGEVELFKGNSKYGTGEYVVAEADESDGSFLYLKPLHSVITNVEMEHIDYYKTLEDAVDSYAAFANNTKKGGCLFYNAEDENIRKVLKKFNGNKESFGFSKDADIYPHEIMMNEFYTSYLCVYKNEVIGRVSLRIPGKHNILNSLAAILAGFKLGLSFESICRSIQDFAGAKRRFHLRADVDGVMLIDDYAHHPTEIRAVLDACRNWKDRRVIVVFQPHRYTRTKFLAEEFGRCFKGADKMILTDIYAASEEPIEGVSVKNIYDRVRLHGLNDVTMMNKESVTRHIMDIKRSGDMIVVLGAGDIKEVSDELSKKLNKR